MTIDYKDAVNKDYVAFFGALTLLEEHLTTTTTVPLFGLGRWLTLEMYAG